MPWNRKRGKYGSGGDSDRFLELFVPVEINKEATKNRLKLFPYSENSYQYCTNKVKFKILQWFLHGFILHF